MHTGFGLGLRPNYCFGKTITETLRHILRATEGLVEGVKDASYSNKIVVQEVGASATRLAAGAATNADGALAWVQENGTTIGTYNSAAEQFH